jgi:hypothetical protein
MLSGWLERKDLQLIMRQADHGSYIRTLTSTLWTLKSIP